MRFTLKIDCGNAAFAEPDAATEVARILRELALELETGGRMQPIALRDFNGNSVGFAQFLGK